MTKIISLIYLALLCITSFAQEIDDYEEFKDTSRASLERCFGSWHYEGSLFKEKPPKGAKYLKLIIAQNQIQLGNAIGRVKSWNTYCFGKEDLDLMFRLQARRLSPNPEKVWLIEPKDVWVKNNIYKTHLSIFMGSDNDKLFIETEDAYFIYRRDGSEEKKPVPASGHRKTTPCNLSSLFGTYRFVKALHTRQDEDQWKKYDIIIAKNTNVVRDTVTRVVKWSVKSYDADSLLYHFQLNMEDIAPGNANVCVLSETVRSYDTYLEYPFGIFINENEMIYNYSDDKLYLYRRVK
ncbi:MAG: hypothetical protein LWX56_10390 [Ignavibacteria bacterium]|nr:hypothetical protein [Ignavibacteria bacterium]